ncbi:hypothetical protein L7F22_061638 [Adiantum nelumboides]|nr:hypothetical protein [Adiantum nelumboides]
MTSTITRVLKHLTGIGTTGHCGGCEAVPPALRNALILEHFPPWSTASSQSGGARAAATAAEDALQDALLGDIGGLRLHCHHLQALVERELMFHRLRMKVLVLQQQVQGSGSSVASEPVEELTKTSEQSLEFVERRHEFPGMVLSVREFAFHVLNANLLWPGTLFFADWLVSHQHVLRGEKVLELGSGTGALAIFLKKALSTDITTSDYDDEFIEENIAYNCEANGLAKLPHIRHTWGDTFPASEVSEVSYDLILASDILLFQGVAGVAAKAAFQLVLRCIEEGVGVAVALDSRPCWTAGYC